MFIKELTGISQINIYALKDILTYEKGSEGMAVFLIENVSEAKCGIFLEKRN